jgi:hypothetical protein
MDLLERPDYKSVSSLTIVAMLAVASLVLYIITHYVIQSNPLLPFQFDFETYTLCLIITIVFVSIPPLIIYKMERG